MRKHKAPFGKSDAVKGCGAAFDDAERMRVGKAGVFAGGNKHAPEYKMRIFSRCEHARHPIHSRIRIASAKAFYKGADNVVVIVAVAVVQHDFFLNAFFGRFAAYVNAASFRRNAGMFLRRPAFGGRFDGKFQRV